GIDHAAQPVGTTIEHHGMSRTPGWGRSRPPVCRNHLFGDDVDQALKVLWAEHVSPVRSALRAGESSSLRGASPLGLPHTLARGAPFGPTPLAWAHSRARSPRRSF